MAKHHPINFAVIGLGNFGSTVATELKRFGNYVIGIDIDEERVSAHAEELDQALIVDARSEAALKDAGVSECDVAVVSLGDDLEASVLATMNLKLIGVDKIWAKAMSKTHHRILNKLGADQVVHPEEKVGQQVAQVLHNPMVRDYVSLGNTFNVVNMRVSDALNGKSLNDLNVDQFDLRVLGVMRGTEFIGRGGDTCGLQEDDILLMLGRRKDLRSFTESLE